MRLNFHQVPQNIKQHLVGGLICIDAMDDFAAIKIEHRLAFALVRLQASFDHVNICIIQPIFFERAALQPVGEIILFFAAQIKNRDDLQSIAEHLSLPSAAGNAVQHERVIVGMEAAGMGAVVNEFAPQINRWLVRHKLAAAGVLKEDLAQRTVGFEAAKDFSAGAVKKIGDRAEDFALSSLACTGSAEQQDGAEFHGASLCLTMISLISVKGINTSSEAPPRCTWTCRSLAAIRLIRWPWN